LGTSTYKPKIIETSFPQVIRRLAHASKKSFGYFTTSFSSFDELLFMNRPKITYRNTVLRVSVPSEEWQQLQSKNT